MDPGVLLPPVAEVPAPPSVPQPTVHLSSLRPSHPYPLHVLSLVSEDRSWSTSNTCSESHPRKPPRPHRYQPALLCPAHLALCLCVVWSTEAWETCDCSAGYRELWSAVFWEKEEEREQGKHSDTSTFCTNWEHDDSARGQADYSEQECVSDELFACIIAFEQSCSAESITFCSS